MTKRRHPRAGEISVSGRTYQRLQARVANVGGFVDKLIAQTLDDPELAREIVERLTN